MLEEISSNKMFGGVQKHFQHYAESVKCQMRFAIYLPLCANESSPVPVLYWLSGLTCTDENFVQKAGAQRIAEALGIAIFVLILARVAIMLPMMKTNLMI